jgi:hypothetical protein
MPHSTKLPPLKSLHPDSYLNAAKLAQMDGVSTEGLQASLQPGQGIS